MNIQELVTGLPPIKSTLSTCEGCILGIHHKVPYPTESATCATEVLALVHTDLCSPMKTPSFGGAVYFLFFIDDYTRYTHIYFLK
jgi:hypothetical protein